MDPGLRADVLASLARARRRTLTFLTAWSISALGAISLFSSYGLGLVWPEPLHEVRGQVTAVRLAEGGEVVTFEGRGPEGVFRWQRFLEDNSWEVGEAIEGWVTEGDRFYQHMIGPSWMGGPGNFFWVGTGIVLLVIFRRLLGIILAERDAIGGRDKPRFAHIALVDNPIPRAWRPMLLIWWQNPLPAHQAPYTDLSLIADEDTGKEFMSDPMNIDVWEGWVDTGRFAWMKPRWVAIKSTGVVWVPHRRATIAGAVGPGTAPLRQGGTDEQAPLASTVRDPNFVKVLAPRFAALVVLALGSNFLTGWDQVTLI